MESSKVDSPDISPEISQVPQESEPQTARGRDRWAPVKKIFKNPITRIFLMVGALLPGAPPADVLANAVNNSSKDQGHELQLKSGMPSVKVYEQQVSAEAPLPPNYAGPAETSAQIEERLKGNFKDVTAMTDVDKDGNVVQMFAAVALKDGTYDLDRSTRDPETGEFSAYEGIFKFPMVVRSLTTSSDGQRVFAAGEKSVLSGMTTIMMSGDGGLRFDYIPWPDKLPQLSGPTVDLFRITGNLYLGNNGLGGVPSPETAVGQFLVRVNPEGQAKIQEIRWQKDKTDVVVGAAFDLGFISVDEVSHKIRMVSNGSYNFQKGINLYELDYSTGLGTMENITTVKIDGVLTNLGWDLRGRGIIDKKGRTNVKVSNIMRQTLYEVDITPTSDRTTKTAKKFYYANLLDNKRIPNYEKGSLSVGAIEEVNINGREVTTLMGGYSSSKDYMGRPIFVIFEDSNFEGSSFIDIEPDKPSGSLGQKVMQRKMINGYLGFELNIHSLGKVFIPDGALEALWVGRGLGSEVKVLPTTPGIKLTPGPSSSPGYGVFIPFSSKS